MSTRRRTAGRFFVGTSGWNYKHWAGGVFYPPGLKQSAWLEFYARTFESVEINNTFYHLPERHVFEDWHDRTPAGFTFAVKASRFITHMKKLAEAEQHVALFLERAAALREKLGVVLFQLPPFWKFNAARLGGLLEFLRRQTIVPGVRAALEVRHPSWHCAECFDILSRHKAALVFADWPGCGIAGPVTADFIFIRRHGPAGLYASGYSATALRRDAAQTRDWLAAGRDVFAYFNNDARGYALRDAQRLTKYLGYPSAGSTG